MKRILSLIAFLWFAAALIVGIATKEDEKDESEFVKSFRDPERVDQRWVYVAGFGSASICFALWSMYEKRK